MLVDNKFIFISLPRCASTSFHISCVRNNLSVKFADSNANNQLYDLSLTNDELAKQITHLHERINELDLQFGTGYDIISIKRNRYDRYLSLWNFVIKESLRYGMDVYNTLNSMNIDDILFFKHTDLTKSNIDKTIHSFLIKYNLVDTVDNYFKNLLFILFQPTSLWHNNDSRIKWFDFNKISELEKWVSDKTNKPFKLEFSNSSKNINTSLNYNFIKKYNEIYDIFDLHKTNKTFI